MKRFLCSVLYCLLVFGAGVVVAATPEEKVTTEKTSQRGPVTAQVKITPTQPRLGDDITLIVKVETEKDIELFMPEFGQSLDRFAIVDYLPQESIDPQGKTIITQTYTLQTPMSGEQTIPPLIIEFIDRRKGHSPAPEGEDAYELLTESLTFDVASVLPKGAASDLKPPMGSLQPLQRDQGASWLWLLVLIPLLLAAPFAWRQWLNWRGEVRQRSAYDIASGRLQVMMAAARPGPEEMDSFFVELSDIIRRYLEDRFQLRAPERTTEEFLEIATGSPDLTAEHRGFLHQFLAYADRVKFAQHLPQVEQVDQTLAAAENFLNQTKEVIHAQ